MRQNIRGNYQDKEEEREPFAEDPLVHIYNADLHNKPDWDFDNFSNWIQDPSSRTSLSSNIGHLRVIFPEAVETVPVNVTGWCFWPFDVCLLLL